MTGENSGTKKFSYLERYGLPLIRRNIIVSISLVVLGILFLSLAFLLVAFNVVSFVSVGFILIVIFGTATFCTGLILYLVRPNNFYFKKIRLLRDNGNSSELNQIMNAQGQKVALAMYALGDMGIICDKNIRAELNRRKKGNL